MPINKEPLDVSKLFEGYLRIVGLDPKRISTVQLDETRKAFYAGFGNMLLIMSEHFTTYDTDEEITDAFNHLHDQVIETFKGFIKGTLNDN